MPIPTMNEQRHVQAPNVARGQAFDNSQAVKDSFNNTLNILKGIENASNAYLKYQRMQDMADDEMKKNQLYTEFSDEMNRLNTELSSKRGVQALEFQKKYKDEYAKIHNKLINGLGSIRNHGVREDLRNQTNSYVSNNNQQAELFFEKAKMQVEEESAVSYLNTLAQNSYDEIDVSSINNATKSSSDIMAQAEITIAKRAMSQGWTPERTRAESDAYRASIVGQGARKIATMQDWETGGFVSLQPVFDYIKQNEGRITSSDANALYQEYEKKGLAVEVKGIINQIVKPDGTINYSLVKTKTPHLSYDERLTLIDSLVASSNKGLSAQEAVDQSLMEEAAWDQTKTMLNNVGLDHLLPTERQVSNLFQGDDKKSFKAEQTRLFKEASISDLVSVALDISQQANTQIVRNPQTGKVLDTTNDKEKLLQYQAAGYLIENKQQRKDYQVLQSQLWAAVQEKTRAGAFSNITGSKWFKGTKPTVEEVIDYNIAKTINDAITPSWFARTFQGERAKNVPAAALSGMITSARRAATETAKMNGFLLSGEADALTANQKDLVARAVSAQMAQHMPESMLQYMRNNATGRTLTTPQTADDFFNVTSQTQKHIQRALSPSGSAFAPITPAGPLGVVATGVGFDIAGSFWNYLSNNTPTASNIAKQK